MTITVQMVTEHAGLPPVVQDVAIKELTAQERQWLEQAGNPSAEQVEQLNAVDLSSFELGKVIDHLLAQVAILKAGVSPYRQAKMRMLPPQEMEDASRREWRKAVACVRLREQALNGARRRRPEQCGLA